MFPSDDAITRELLDMEQDVLDVERGCSAIIKHCLDAQNSDLLELDEENIVWMAERVEAQGKAIKDRWEAVLATLRANKTGQPVADL